MSSWFIYIAENRYRAGKSLNATEKKIGCTNDVEALQREFDSVASPIFCSVMAAWKTESDDQGEKILSALRHILSDSHLDDTPGWFDDSSGTLCDRLSGFMNCFGYALVSTINPDDEIYLDDDDDDDDGDGASDRLESPLQTTSASTSILKQREDLLVGEVFSYTYKGVKNTVKQGCRRPARPARSACQAGHLARPGRPDPGLTGRQASYYYKLLIHFAMSL